MGETYQKEQAFLEDTAAAWDPQSPLKRGEPFPAPEKQAPAEAKLVSCRSRSFCQTAR